MNIGYYFNRMLLFLVHRSLTIPFSTSETATLVQEILNVDKELKGSGVSRVITANNETVHM